MVVFFVVICTLLYLVFGTKPCVEYPLIHSFSNTQSGSPISWSEDGTQLAYISSDRFTQVWNFIEWQQQVVISDGGQYVQSIAWSPNNVYIASVVAGKNTIMITNVKKKTALPLLLGHGVINAIAWQSHGELLASGSGGGEIMIWNVTSGRSILTIKVGAKSVTSVAWSSQGVLAAGCTDSNSVKLFNALTGTSLRNITVPNIPSELVWSSDGRKLAYVVENEYVALWDAVDGTQLPLQTTWRLVSVSWSPDARYVVAGASSGPLGIWDAAKGGLQRTLDGHSGGTQFVSWSPDARQIASSGLGDQTVKVWDTTPAPSFLAFTATANIKSATLHPQVEQLISLQSGGGMKRWDFNGTIIKEFPAIPGMVITDLSYSPNGEELVSVSESSNDNASLPASITIWNVETAQIVRNITRDMIFPSVLADSRFRCVAWSPDGRWIALALDNSLVVLRADDLALTWQVSNANVVDYVASVDWSSDTEFVAFGTYFGAVNVYDFDLRKIVHNFTRNDFHPVTSVEFSPDGKQMMFGANGEVTIWDTFHSNITRIVAFPDCRWGADGKRIICGSDGNFTSIIDATSGKIIRVMTGTAVFASSSLATSVNGQHVVSWSKEKNVIIVWHVSWVVELLVMQTPTRVFLDLIAFGLDNMTTSIQLESFSSPSQCYQYDLVNQKVDFALLPPGFYQSFLHNWYQGAKFLLPPISINCPPGTELQLNNNTCTPCEGNFYQPHPSATRCVFCDGIVKNNHTDCVQCPANSYLPINNSTLCVCTPRFYAVYGPNHQLSCTLCPPHGFCDNGLLRADDGYWLTLDNRSDILHCPVIKACVNGGCASGYKGVLCGECTEGYGPAGFNKCVACWDEGWNIVATIVLMLVVILTCGTLAILSMKADVTSPNIPASAFKVGLSAAQINSRLLQLDVTMPSWLNDMMILQDGVQGTPTSFTISCSIMGVAGPEEVFFKQALFSALTPPMLILLLLGGLFVVRLYRLHKGTPLEESRRWLWDWGVTGASAIFFVLYPDLIVQTFRLFPCQSVDFGEQRLMSDLSVRCDATTTERYLLGFSMLFVYLVLPPLVAFWYIMKKVPLEARHETQINKLLFLCNDFKAERAWWGFVVMLRKVASAIIVTFLTGHVQLAAMIVVLSCFMFVHLWVNPYCKTLQKVGLLEAVSLLLSIFLFGCAIVFLEDIESSASSVAGVSATVFLIIFYFAVFVIIVRNIREHIKKARDRCANCWRKCFHPDENHPDENAHGYALM